MKYMLFYTGLVSTPFSVGLKNLSTNEVVCEISTDSSQSKISRQKVEKYINNVIEEMQENCKHVSNPQIYTNFDMEIMEGEIN